MAIHVIDLGQPGPLIQVGIRAGASFEASGRGGAPRSYSALIDTGASSSAISHKVVADVRPQSAGGMTLGRIGAAPVALPTYEVRLKFEHHLAAGRWFGLEAVRTNRVTPGIDVLIGQDLLLQLTFLYNGPLGKLILMF
jgi:hypothetical protein